MFENLNGKKLLILGGIQRTCAIVRRAQQLGVYVIVADYDPHSPAKKIADEAVLIDAVDVEALVKYCLENAVDGVTTAYVDFLLPICMEIGRRIGSQFYADETMIELSTDKVAFKACCDNYGVPVPRTYSVGPDDYVEASNTLSYPVFLKPVDASGSRGADICLGPEDFIAKYERALSFSKRKEVTVEEYLYGTEFILDYLLIDGEPYFLSMADRFTDPDRPVAINHPNLMLLPSRNLERYYAEVDEKVRNMFRKLGFKNGIVFLQGYAREGRIAFYEMGCRLGGTWPYIDEAFTGFNPIDLLVSHAITGQMVPKGSELSGITARFGGVASIVYFIATQGEGTICAIKGVDEILSMPEVVTTLQYYWEGDHYALGSLTDILFLAVHLVSENMESLNRATEKVYSLIDFLDECGTSLISRVVHICDVCNTEE